MKLTKLQLTTNALNRLGIEREQIKAQRAALRADIKVASNKELLEQAFKEAGTQAAKTYKLGGRKLSKKDKIGFYTYADLHFKGQQSIKNLKLFFRKLKQDIKTRGFDRVVLFSGGDDLEGAHRESTLLSIDKMPTGQAILYQKIVLNEFVEIAKLVKKLDIHFLTSSNHTEWRIQGTAGEFPEDDALRLIAEYIKLGLSNVKNVTFKASSWFRSIKYGKMNIAFAHGNKAIHKNLYKFKAFAPAATIVMRAHTHHSELIQEPTFDNLVAPSTKLHVEHYEEGGGWANKMDGVSSSRTGQFIEFIPNEKGRVQELRIISV